MPSEFSSGLQACAQAFRHGSTSSSCRSALKSMVMVGRSSSDVRDLDPADQKREEAQPRHKLLGRERRLAGAVVAQADVVEAGSAGRKQRHRDVAAQHRIKSRDRADLGLDRLAHPVGRHQQRQYAEARRQPPRAKIATPASPRRLMPVAAVTRRLSQAFRRECRATIARGNRSRNLHTLLCRFRGRRMVYAGRMYCSFRGCFTRRARRADSACCDLKARLGLGLDLIEARRPVRARSASCRPCSPCRW